MTIEKLEKAIDIKNRLDVLKERLYCIEQENQTIKVSVTDYSIGRGFCYEYTPSDIFNENDFFLSEEIRKTIVASAKSEINQ